MRSTINVRGIDLSVQRSGVGPAFLWCHGLTSSIENEDDANLWSLAAPVTSAGFELIRFDARDTDDPTDR